jgi:hypothetical protein
MTRAAQRFLLPHEPWLVGWMRRSQRAHRTAVVALEQKYGPPGSLLRALLVRRFATSKRHTPQVASPHALQTAEVSRIWLKSLPDVSWPIRPCAPWTARPRTGSPVLQPASATGSGCDT